MRDNPRILWVGDAVVSTGFSRCTHAVCDHLSDVGWDVHVLGLNYFGDPHSRSYSVYPTYQPYDSGTDMFGVGRLPVLAHRLKPDVIVILNDPWNVKAYTESYDSYIDKIEDANEDGKWDETVNRMRSTPIVGWLAVDADNQKGEPLNRLSHVVTWTQHAQDQLELGGYTGPFSQVPLGVDGRFKPYNRVQSRKEVFTNFPEDAFLFGAVGRNQPRKRLDLTLEYFAEFLQHTQAQDAYLYLHVAPTGERGFDLKSLASYHGLQGRVFLHEVRADKGIDDALMPKMYSSLDCLITTTQGEGWGLPVLEAAACGVPSIVPDWSALGEWTASSAVQVPCTGTAVTAPLNRNPYTIGGVPDKTLFVMSMGQMYEDAAFRSDLALDAVRMSKRYTWELTALEMESVLSDVIG